MTRSHPSLWRRFLQSIPLQAAAIGLLASSVAALSWTAAPSLLATLDWSIYDFWTTYRPMQPPDQSIVIVTRDPAAEELFGSGTWDRAVLAGFVMAAHEAGAAAIGLDHQLSRASPAQRGGPASDALFEEAIRTVPALILATAKADAPLLFDMARVGHLAVQADPDRVVRSLPASAVTETAGPFAIVLYQTSQGATAPITTGSNVLIHYTGDGTLKALPTLDASAVWGAIEQRDAERLSQWFGGKAVVFAVDPAGPDVALLPTGQSAPPLVVHLHALAMLLSAGSLTASSTAVRVVLTLALTGSMAALLLSRKRAAGLISATGVLLLYLPSAVGALAWFHLVVPIATPVFGGLLVLIGTTVWTHLTTHQRVRLMEQDMLRLQQEASAVREALVLHETRTETLQDDLAAARGAAAESAGQQEALVRTAEQLRLQLAGVQSEEEEARSRLAELERQLHSLRAAAMEPVVLGDAELERLQDECRRLGIISQDPALLTLYRDLKKGARAPLTVLLLGEPGTGKELFARAVHRLSPRSDKTFIAVNMAAISPDLFESELFGHTKGGFTGATSDRRGYFELADHGTIFLDEIGDLRLDHQSKLLRVLQEKSFYRVGATRPTTVDVRIVAATNRDLQRGVSEGWFREDLYFRLTGLVFRLPPLRERTGDIPLLAAAFLTDIARQLGRPMPSLSNDAVQALTSHEWRGNVRELRHCLEQAVALTDGLLIGKDSLRLDRGAATGLGRGKGTPLLPEPAGDAAVLACLRRHAFDMQATARALCWDRSTVTQRLKGLCFQALVESDGDHAKAALVIAGDPSHQRVVELKLMDYHGHLLSVIEPYASADEALAGCKRRFKNLADRHFAHVETLVRRYFASRAEGGRGAS